MSRELLALAEKSAETDLAFLLKAKEEAKKRMKDNPSQENISAFNKSRGAVDAETARLSLGESVLLKNPQAVLAYLKESGRKIGKSKVYDDIKLGALRCQADGTFRKRDVDVYAASLTPLAGVALKDKDRAARAAIRKAEASAKREEEHYKTLARKRQILEGKYLPKAEVLAMFAGRAALLEQSLKSMMRSDAALMVEAVQGNPDCTAALYAIFERSLHGVLAEYVKADGFELRFTQEALAELEELTEESAPQPGDNEYGDDDDD